MASVGQLEPQNPGFSRQVRFCIYTTSLLVPLAAHGIPQPFSPHHSPTASILLRSAAPGAQFSHPYIIAGKTTALTSPPAVVCRAISLLSQILLILTVAVQLKVILCLIAGAELPRLIQGRLRTGLIK